MFDFLYIPVKIILTMLFKHILEYSLSGYSIQVTIDSVNMKHLVDNLSPSVGCEVKYQLRAELYTYAAPCWSHQSVYTHIHTNNHQTV